MNEYEYEDSQLEDIYALRAIIEMMLNNNYLWSSADSPIFSATNRVKINLLLSEYTLPDITEPLWKRVTFAFDDWRHSWLLYPLEEMEKDLFWHRLEVSDYLIKPRKDRKEHIYEVKYKTIWEAAKYLRQNVLVRNVKLFY